MAFHDTKSESGRDEAGTKKRKGWGGKYPKGKKAKGAELATGTTRPAVVVEKLDHLVDLLRHEKDAAEERKEAVKEVAKEAGYDESAVNALVSAKYNDKYEEKRRKIEQQAELFAEAE